MFKPEQRDALRDRLLDSARSDPRIVAAALIGGSAIGGDRWSDLDLGFGVDPAESLPEVLVDWTARLQAEEGAAHLFDLPHLGSLYRVFLLPGALQVDLSFTPAAQFGALGPRFTLLFGEAQERRPPEPQPADQAFGLAVHHAVRARICIERGRLWQAEHWIGALRDDALGLACRRLGLEFSHGRGLDRLPAEVLDRARAAMPAAVEREELLSALRGAVELLLSERTAAGELAAQVEGDLRAMLLPAGRGESPA